MCFNTSRNGGTGNSAGLKRQAAGKIFHFHTALTGKNRVEPDFEFVFHSAEVSLSKTLALFWYYHQCVILTLDMPGKTYKELQGAADKLTL